MSLALAGLAAQTALGLGQTIAGAFRKKPIIPEADIPEEVFQNMTDAEYWSHIGMPPEQRQRHVEDIQRTGATAMGRARGRKAGMGLISGIAQSETEGYRGLAETDVNLRYRNLDRLERARNRMAEERNRAADINRNIALDERARRDEMIGAGMQNIMGALGTGSTMAAMFPEQFQGGLFGGGGRNSRARNKMLARSGGVGMSSVDVAGSLGLDPFPSSQAFGQQIKPLTSTRDYNSGPYPYKF